MKQLSGLDASFLYMETAEMPMHVGALHVFELPAGYKGSFLADVRRHIGSRLPLAPALGRKLAWMPFNLANPVWVDGAPDLAQHIVGIKLPKNSGLAELSEQVGRLHPVLLDRERPLWKFHVFEGLAPGPNQEKRFGLYTQLHHAAVDGQAAIALAQAILDVQAKPRDIEHEARPAKKMQLGLAEMLSGVLAHQLQQYGNIVKSLPSTVGALTQVAAQGAGSVASRVASSAAAKMRGPQASHRAPEAPDAPGVSIGLAPRMRLNASVTAERAFAAVSLPIAQIKALRRAHDATLNDVVLMVCGGALRRHFLQHGPLPRKSMVAAVPVSTRAAGDTTANNQASMTVVNLGTHLADPMERLNYVKAASAAMKSTLSSVKSLMPTDFPSLGVPWLMSTITSLYGKAGIADRIPPIANVVISNVPGPAFPLYMAGGRMLCNHPTSIVVHGVGLNITVQSYNESLDFGLIACARAMPDVADLAGHMLDALAELLALPPTAQAAQTPAKATPRAAPAKKPAKEPTKEPAKNPAKERAAAPRKRAVPEATPRTSGRSRARAPAKAAAAR